VNIEEAFKAHPELISHMTVIITMQVTFLSGLLDSRYSKRRFCYLGYAEEEHHFEITEIGESFNYRLINYTRALVHGHTRI